MTSRKMKDSGVEWIHLIPSDWQTTKVKRLGDFINGFAFKPTNWGDQGLPIIRIQNLTNSNNEYNYFNDEIDNKYVVEKGDYLISWSATLDVFRWTGETAVLNQHIFKVLLNEKIVDYSFFYWHAKQFIDEMSNHKHGSTMQHVTKGVFDNFVVALPPLKEQQKIAAFLDEKVAHIDNIIEDTKKSIENLKAYKQSLITETVTKGLNPDVEMKDSGIDWIGDIPKYWKIYKIGQIFKEHKEKNDGLIEDNLLSLSYGKVKRRDIKSKEGLLPQSFEGYNIIKPGDIVLRMTDLQNDQKSLRVGLCKEKGIITSAYISIRAYNNIYPHYAYYYLHSFDIYKGFYGMGAGVRQGVNFNELKKLDILFPTYDEQKQIAIVLDEKSRTIESTIEQKEQLITELEAYKKSLIYEYVTGKKEVK